MISTSQPTTFEQWHRQLTHCSPLTIKGMASNNMVDGLRITNEDVSGKCRDCILGRQTHHPFDGLTEEKPDPPQSCCIQPLGTIPRTIWWGKVLHDDHS